MRKNFVPARRTSYRLFDARLEFDDEPVTGRLGDASQLAIGRKGNMIERPVRGIATSMSARLLLGQPIGTLEDAIFLIDIERLIPETGEGLLAVASIGEIPPVPAPRRNGDEISKMIADMLLHDVVGTEMFGDLSIDLVPRATDLSLQITAQRAEVFVELLRATGEGMGSAHTLVFRQILERQGAPPTINPAAARTLNMSARMVQLP